MNIQEKLLKLTSGMNRADLARRADVKPTVLNNYINRGSEPMANAIFRLARALRVPLEWLVDDEQNWPPPSSSKSDISNVNDRALMFELARRYRLAEMDFLDEADRARNVDWKKAAEELERTPEGKAIPTYARRAMNILGAVQVKSGRFTHDFDVHVNSILHHDELPGSERSLEEYDAASRGFIWSEIEQLPFIQRFADSLKNRPEWLGSDFHRLSEAYSDSYRRYQEGLEKQSKARNTLWKKRLERASKSD